MTLVVRGCSITETIFAKVNFRFNNDANLFRAMEKRGSFHDRVVGGSSVVPSSRLLSRNISDC